MPYQITATPQIDAELELLQAHYSNLDEINDFDIALALVGLDVDEYRELEKEVNSAKWVKVQL